MSAYSDGRRREYQVRDHLATHGWEPIMRASSSKGPADLLMGHEYYGALLVQVGSKTKTLGPADRARLVHAADLISAMPILAVVIPRKGIRYFEVTPGVPSSWGEWEPQSMPNWLGPMPTVGGTVDVPDPGQLLS